MNPWAIAIVLFWVSVFMNVASLLANRNLRIRLAKKAEVFLGDDHMMSLLEAHSGTSNLAMKLLMAAKEPSIPKLPPIEEWKHNLNFLTPSNEYWALFLKDIGLESTDEGKVLCLNRWLESGSRFSKFERVEIASMIQDMEWRDAARAAFNRSEGKKTAEPKK